MIILALDLGRTTGFALHQHGVITVGSKNFPNKRGESPGMLYLRFDGWLREISALCLNRIDLVAYEQAHNRGGAATQILNGLSAKVMEFAARLDTQICTVHTSTLKKWATGKGNASKDDMIAKARELGHQVADDNEADAVLLLRCQMEELGI